MQGLRLASSVSEYAFCLNGTNDFDAIYVLAYQIVYLISLAITLFAYNHITVRPIIGEPKELFNHPAREHTTKRKEVSTAAVNRPLPVAESRRGKRPSNLPPVAGNLNLCLPANNIAQDERQ